MTERYRLALIAHHAEKLAGLIEKGKIRNNWSMVDIAVLYLIFPKSLRKLATDINEHLNLTKEEAK